MKKLILFIITIFMCNIITAQEIKPFKINLEFTLDEYGNSKVIYSCKMNASQWDNFKRSTGNNQSLLKREIEKGLPAFFLSDFEYKEDAMDRSYSLSFNAKGVATINSKGKWVVDLDAKNPDVTKLSDNTYMMITESSAGGQLIQTTNKLVFPESATDIKEEKDSFGKAIFTFDMGGSSGMGKAMQYGGIGLIVAGLFLGWRKSKQA
ncbi:MAG TPA: hypothetical protein PKN75_01990 [Bacteroidia bacterium]|nr:hypothetical protein [Bacteroidia bacterium]HNU32345.1 hypothetical protein [Bacteroidia bacterium]